MNLVQKEFLYHSLAPIFDLYVIILRDRISPQLPVPLEVSHANLHVSLAWITETYYFTNLLKMAHQNPFQEPHARKSYSTKLFAVTSDTTKIAPVWSKVRQRKIGLEKWISLKLKIINKIYYFFDFCGCGANRFQPLRGKFHIFQFVFVHIVIIKFTIAKSLV